MRHILLSCVILLLALAFCLFSMLHGGQPRGRGEKDAVKMVAMPGQAQPQMLATADLGKIGHGHIAHVKHRPRTARPAGLELI